MAMDTFIKIDGIEGEARDKDHGKEIDVLSWSWGCTQSGYAHVGGGGGAGKVNVQDLSFTKYVDKSTANLLLHCCNGKHIAECKVTVRKAGENPVEYLKITMTDVMVTSCSTGGSGGEDRLTENITLNFAKVKVEYQEQDKAGKGAGTHQMGWNIEENAKM